LIIGAAAVLAWGWGIDVVHLAAQDTWLARVVHSVLSAVVILLGADLLWHAIKTAIDRKLADSADPGLPNTEEARRRSRLRTLLPIFRNILFVVVILVAAMMVLAEMGVQIGHWSAQRAFWALRSALARRALFATSSPACSI
jgi:small-conductance mechanosensitive channel